MDTSQPVHTDTPKSSGAELKGFSCLGCRQRKVRCDRRAPCLNCERAGRQCSFIAPVRGKRKKTKPPRETLHAKLKRYEEMLKSYGARIDPSDDFDGLDSELESRLTPESNRGAVPIGIQSDCQTATVEDTKPKFIMKEGASRYFDSALWSTLSNDFQHPESTNFNDVGEDVHIEQDGHIDESGLFFEPEHSDKIENLSKLHVSTTLLSKLKDVYIDRVDPMMKILHLPTFWILLANALRRPRNMPKSLESLIFAFYLVTVSSLNEEECQDLFGVPTSAIISRYRLATRQALVNARFLSTSNFMTLQAFSIFTVGVRNTYRCDTLYILSGVAIRLARKMGLHRDGTFLGLPPFETEMRRRLWWHLAHIDCRTADVMGTKPSPEISNGDTKKPINVEDDELHPDMKNLPNDHSGITAITLCLIKCEIMEALCKFASPYPSDLRWEMLYNPEISLTRKDNIIDSVEDYLEKKYLRYGDPSNTLHIFISVMIRSAVCKMRLFAHNVRQFAHKSSKATQHDHNVSFFNAMKLLEYANLMHGGHMGLDKYLWQIGTSYLWNIMLYLLIEVRCRKTGPDVDKAWELIAVVFSRCPQVLEEFTGSVYVALGKWTLEIWESYVEASNGEGLPDPVTPTYINEIREWQKTKEQSRGTAKSDWEEARPADQHSTGHEKFSYADYVDGGFSEFQYFPNLFSFEVDPNQWMQWEQFVAE